MFETNLNVYCIFFEFRAHFTCKNAPVLVLKDSKKADSSHRQGPFFEDRDVCEPDKTFPCLECMTGDATPFSGGLFWRQVFFLRSFHVNQQ